MRVGLEWSGGGDRADACFAAVHVPPLRRIDAQNASSSAAQALPSLQEPATPRTLPAADGGCSSQPWQSQRVATPRAALQSPQKPATPRTLPAADGGCSSQPWPSQRPARCSSTHAPQTPRAADRSFSREPHSMRRWSCCRCALVAAAPATSKRLVLPLSSSSPSPPPRHDTVARIHAQ